MKNLTSINNDMVKFVVSLHQKKYRDINSAFIVEGEKSLEAAIKYGFSIRNVFVLENYKINFNIDDEIKIIVNEKIMKKISTTDNTPNLLSVIQKKENDTYLIKNKSKILLIENIKDAGNLGTIIRSAVAFGIEGIILFADVCDPYNSKVIRSSAGTFFYLPIVEYKSFEKLTEDFKNFKFISTNLHKKSDIEIYEIKDKFVLMFGGEAEGLSKKMTTLADCNIVLPMKNSVESLNLATAVSVLLYEISKNF